MPRSMKLRNVKEENLRYKNELYAVSEKCKRKSLNSSHPDLISLQSDPRNSLYNYDVPGFTGLKKTRSYMEMNLIQEEKSRENKNVSHKNNSFDSVKRESECATTRSNRTTINNNLNTNNFDKVPKDKDIEFKFSNLNNLTQHLTTTSV